MAASIIPIIILLDILSFSQATECGGFLSATTSVQNITSPNYPEEYPNNLTCRWIISPSEPDMDLRIVVNINLHKSTFGRGCWNDTLRIYSGSPGLLILDHLCGTDTKTIETTGDSNITVILTTDEFVNKKRGMHLQFYQTSEPEKVVESSLEMASVYSENLFSYKSNSVSTWLFKKSDGFQGHHVLRFVEFSQANWTCSEQYVEIYNGDSKSAPLLGRYCGTGDPDFIGSASLFVRLVTGRFPIGQGLRIIHFLAGRTVKKNIYLHKNSDKFGILTSPNYPYFLPSSLTYVVVITFVYKGYIIDVNFIRSSVGSNEDCSTSEISVYDGENILSSEKLGSFCGIQHYRRFTSTKPSILIQMTTGSNVHGKGFTMNYEVMREVVTSPATSTERPLTCGATQLTASSGWRYLTSPGYPHIGGRSINCRWTITAGTFFKMVRVVVIDSSIHGKCENTDHITAYDGGDTYAGVLKFWCGNGIPTVQSTERQMTLRFEADTDSGSRWFKLKYSEVSDPPPCGGTLDATSEPKELRSPGYPYPYAGNLKCKWPFVTKHNFIKISVLDSNLEWSDSCQYDYVTVYDGRSTTGDPVLGTFCGTQTPTYYSSGNAVTLLFRTNGIANYKGFRLAYESTNIRAPATSPSSSSNTNIGGLVGGLVAGVTVVIIVIVIAVSHSIRKRKKACTGRTPTTTTSSYPHIVNPTYNVASASDMSNSGITYQSPGNFHYHPQTNQYNNPAYSTLNTENLSDRYGPPPAYNTLKHDAPYPNGGADVGFGTQGTGVDPQGAGVGTHPSGTGIQNAGVETQGAGVDTEGAAVGPDSSATENPESAMCRL